MRFLLDTNAVSDYMRGDAPITKRLTALPPSDEAIICSIVRGEVLFGIERLPVGQRRSALEAAAAMTLPSLPCLSVPAQAGDHYASIKLACQRRGVALDENDLWIAASALTLGATLVTRDQDFTRVVGLTVEDWSV
jgi:predicted nucleic acid-binding protein